MFPRFPESSAVLLMTPSDRKVTNQSVFCDDIKKSNSRNTHNKVPSQLGETNQPSFLFRLDADGWRLSGLAAAFL